jgi:hypothetical protein
MAMLERTLRKYGFIPSASFETAQLIAELIKGRWHELNANQRSLKRIPSSRGVRCFKIGPHTAVAHVIERLKLQPTDTGSRGSENKLDSVRGSPREARHCGYQRSDGLLGTPSQSRPPKLDVFGCDTKAHEAITVVIEATADD